MAVHVARRGAEVKNAVNQATKELIQRYDLKSSNSTIDIDERRGCSPSARVTSTASRRVSGKNRDDLQYVMALLKEEDLGIDMSLTNYR